MEIISPHQTYLSLHKIHTLMILKYKSLLPTLQELSPALWRRTFEQGYFDIQPTNPQADIVATGRCRYWITDIDLKAPRNRYQIPLRRPYTPRRVQCHSSLHL
jgi:hypothetical protein